MKKKNHKINQIDLIDNKINNNKNKNKIINIKTIIKYKVNNILINKNNHNKEEENKEIVMQINFIKFKKINQYKLNKINL